MSPTNANPPVAKSRLTKNRRKSGIVKAAPLSTRSVPTSSTPSHPDRLTKASKPVSMVPPPSLPTPSYTTDSASPTYYRNYEVLTSSPFHIPNSQAPIPGREVYWDLDTPQSKKYREALAREFEESDSPISKQNVATPKLRMVPKTRIDTATSKEVVRKGEEAMELLLNMCREKEEEMREKDEKVEPVCQLKMENFSMELKEETKEEEADDMFADDFDLGDTLDFGVEEEITVNKINTHSVKDNGDMLDTALDNDMFDDDDESFLLQATQAAETDLVSENVERAVIKTEQTSKPSVVHHAVTRVKQRPQEVVGNVGIEKTFNQTARQEPVKMKTEPVVTHPAISRVQAQVTDGFGSEDDSFDEILSQMEEPQDEEVSAASPILKRKRKCFDLSGPTKPYQPLPLSELNRQVSGPGTTTQRQAGGTFRKFSSFDNKEEKKAFPRLNSDPSIGTVTLPGTFSSKVATVGRVGSTVNLVGQPGNVGPSKPATRSCTKEDIERKRKEAMARRQQSQSQARR